MQSPRSNGDDFRDQIAGLLRAKFRDVRSEVYLTGKKADLFFCEAMFPVGQRRIAVECKAWSRKSLTSNEIAKIRSEYDPAFKANEIDTLWIISKKPVDALPKNSTTPYGATIQAFSFNELQNSMMNFQDYLIHLIRDFDESGLSFFYMETFTDERLNVQNDIVSPWLSDPLGKPLAFFGGYGMGKSSYAKRLGSWLAHNALKDPYARIPILIRLGGLTQAQSVRDLITVEFAAEHQVQGFNYTLFSQLNALGRFVLIFDGFDEMKHAMRRRDIEANLNSISAYIARGSKILIFGRPDPLVSMDDELFFKGKNRLAGGDPFSDPYRSEFRSYALDVFDEAQSYEFISKYIQWTINHNNKGRDYDQKFVEKRLNELRSIGASELIRRPVHAKILADLALIPDQNIRINSEYELYHEFIFRIGTRETSEKAAREAISVDSRIEFMLDIGWWLWSTKRAESFSILEIPNAISKKWANRFENVEDRETVLREMLLGSVIERSKVSSVLETKDQIRFFFPHRSYWEFLIAEYLARHCFCVDAKVATEEVSNRTDQFIRQRSDREFMVNIGRRFESTNATLSIEFISRVASLQNQSDIERVSQRLLSGEAKEISQLDVVMHIIACARDLAQNGKMIDKYITGLLFNGNIAFNSAFLNSLAWVTVSGMVPLDGQGVFRSWQKISILCVLRAYDDWTSKVDPGLLDSWLQAGKFPHARTFVQRITLRHHSVVGSSQFVAGMIFGKAILLKRRKPLERTSLIKLNVAFISEILGNSVQGIASFNVAGSHGNKFIIDVDVNEVPDDMVSAVDLQKLTKVVDRGKWAIDLGIKV